MNSTTARFLGNSCMFIVLYLSGIIMFGNYQYYQINNIICFQFAFVFLQNLFYLASWRLFKQEIKELKQRLETIRDFKNFERVREEQMKKERDNGKTISVKKKV